MPVVTEGQQPVEDELKVEHLLPEHAAWVDIAPEVAGWHPDLQKHYHANMARLGITHLLSKEAQPPKPNKTEHGVPTLEDAQDIASALQQGKTIDFSVAEELIAWGYGQEVISNFDLISGNTSHLALNLLKTEGVESVMKHLEHMHGLDGTFTLSLLTQLRENPHSYLTN